MLDGIKRATKRFLYKVSDGHGSHSVIHVYCIRVVNCECVVPGVCGPDLGEGRHREVLFPPLQLYLA